MHCTALHVIYLSALLIALHKTSMEAIEDRECSSYEHEKASSFSITYNSSTIHHGKAHQRKIRGFSLHKGSAAECQPAVVRCTTEHSSTSIQTKGEVQKRNWNRWGTEVCKCNIEELRSHRIRHQKAAALTSLYGCLEQWSRPCYFQHHLSVSIRQAIHQRRMGS